MLVVPSLIRAGAETQAVDLANGLAARGHVVHLCVFGRQLDQRERLSNTVHFHHVLRQTKYDRKFIAELAAIIDAEQIDVVQGILLFSTLVAWLAARRSRRKPPVVAAVHTTTNRGWKQELLERLIYRHILRRLPAIVFVCEYQRKHWIKKYPDLRRNSRVVYNGVDPSRLRHDDHFAAGLELRKGLGIPESSFVLACIAGFRREKGHELLIRAFARLSDRAHLLLAGDGERRALIHSEILRVGLESRVHFLGNVADVRPVITAANATVLASTAVETFSIAMLESMALRVPMVAPRIGGLSEAILEGVTGLLFDIGDVDGLALQLARLENNSLLVTSLGRAAESLVSSRFSAERMYKASEAALRFALEYSMMSGNRKEPVR